jgi:hypothetical protein
MRSSDTPLPGDIVISQRQEHTGVRRVTVFVLTSWPQTDAMVGGPYQSYGYALRQAQTLASGKRARVWRDHSAGGDGNALEEVST